LQGAHIARWADEPDLRGHTSNGLCLCLMHDKAFEEGYYTLTNDFHVAVNKTSKRVRNSTWSRMVLLPYEGKPIDIPNGAIVPSLKAIEHHWRRIGFKPESN
jgi:putative restriction endonuclease